LEARGNWTEVRLFHIDSKWSISWRSSFHMETCEFWRSRLCKNDWM